MSNAIYLAASLPMLQFGEQPPFSVEDLLFRCQGVLSDDEYSALQALLAGRPASDSFTQAWYALETQIRNATGKARVAAWGGEARITELMHSGFDVALSRRVTEALGKNNTWEREEELARARWWAADELSGYQGPSLSQVFAFAVKLQINERFARFDKEVGNAVIEKVIQANDRAVGQI